MAPSIAAFPSAATATDALADSVSVAPAESEAHAPDLSMWVRLRSGLQGWAYVSEDGRDLRIDLLRGLAVLAMVVDHIAGPSKLYLITGGNHFYTSAAEGFIFLSGLTVGLVYRRIAERQGLATAIRRLLGRAWTLYVLAVGLTLVMLPFSEVLQAPLGGRHRGNDTAADRLGDLFAPPDVLPRRRPGAVCPVDTGCAAGAVSAV